MKDYALTGCHSAFIELVYYLSLYRSQSPCPDKCHSLSVLCQSLWHGNLFPLCFLYYLFASLSPSHSQLL